MPYTNIVFVKFRLKLLSDIRFLDGLDDGGKLVFMGLLLLAGLTRNRIPNNPVFIKRQLNLSASIDEIKKQLSDIKLQFQGVLSVDKKGHFTNDIGNSQFIKFKNFNKLHNWFGSKIGTEKDTPDKIRRDKIRREENIYVLNHFKKVYKEELKVPYPIVYGKDQKLFYELMDIYSDKEDIIFLIDKFFELARNPKCWWSDKISVGVFKQVLPQIIGKIERK